MHVKTGVNWINFGIVIPKYILLSNILYQVVIKWPQTSMISMKKALNLNKEGVKSLLTRPKYTKIH